MGWEWVDIWGILRDMNAYYSLMSVIQQKLRWKKYIKNDQDIASQR